VDLVAFMATKKSHIDIVQATGRAMRKAPGKSIGYIFLPLYLEQEEGETLEKALKRAKYDEIWDVLEALQEQDDVRADIIKGMRIKQGQGTLGVDDQRFHEKVEFLAPIIRLKELRKAITIRCIELLSELWNYRFGQLLTFKKRFGHCDVPATWKESPSLGQWVAAQRDRYRKRNLPRAQRLALEIGLISQEQIQQLERIGFVWELRDTAWEEKIAKLKAFRDRFGHCNVPKRWKADPSLGQWLLNLRRNYEARMLPENERLAREIGLLTDG
jgi:Helicase associated domain